MNLSKHALTTFASVSIFNDISSIILAVFVVASILLLKKFTCSEASESAIYFSPPSRVTTQEVQRRMPESPNSKEVNSGSNTLKICFCDDFNEPLCEYVAPTIIQVSTTKQKSSMFFSLRTLPSFRRRATRVEPNPEQR